MVKFLYAQQNIKIIWCTQEGDKSEKIGGDNLSLLALLETLKIIRVVATIKKYQWRLFHESFTLLKYKSIQNSYLNIQLADVRWIFWSSPLRNVNIVMLLPQLRASLCGPHCANAQELSVLVARGQKYFGMTIK